MPGSSETPQFAVTQAEKLLGQLAYRISRTRKARDPGSIHDLRVAIRRFAQALIVFDACLPTKEVKKIRRRLKEIRSLAGDVRDCDITLMLLPKAKLDQATALRGKLQSRRKEAEQALLGTLRRFMERKSSLKWRTRLQSASQVEAATPPETVEQTATRILPKMAQRFFNQGKKAAATSASLGVLHKFRIAAKKFRYTLELFASQYGSSLDGWLEQIKSLQTALGAINDCAIARKMLSRLDGGAGLDAALEKKQDKVAGKFRKLWAEEFAGSENIRLHLACLRQFAERRRPAKKPLARSATVGATTHEPQSRQA